MLRVQHRISPNTVLPDTMSPDRLTCLFSGRSRRRASLPGGMLLPPWAHFLRLRVEFFEDRDKSLGLRRQQIVLRADGPRHALNAPELEAEGVADA